MMTEILNQSASSTEETKEIGDREICVAIDPMVISEASLAMAALLADKLNTGLYGLLIGNDLLKQVAQLPFTTEILVTSGDEQAFHADSLELRHRKNILNIQTFFERSTAPRRVRFRLESDAGQITLGMVLERRQDLLLPALARSKPPFAASAGALHSIKWVYDGSKAGENCHKLLTELVAAGIARTVFLLGLCPVPRQLLADLSHRGAKVMWVNVSSVGEMLIQLKSSPTVDMILLPATLMAQIDDTELAAINRQSQSAVLVVS